MGVPQKALRNAVHKGLRDVERKLQQVQRDLQGLEAEREAFLLLAQRHGIDLGPKPHSRNGTAPKSGKRPSATEAVVALLQQQPDKLSSRDVINLLEHQIETKAKRPRRLLRATIDLLRRKGRIAVNMEGRLSLMPSPHLVGRVTKVE